MHTSQKIAYINGKIFTSDRENLYAEALTVEGGRVTWIGAQADIPAGPYDETVDLQGRRVLPGFVDAHEHPVMLADFSKKISSLPPKVNSIEELKQAIRDVRKVQGPANGSKAGVMMRANCLSTALPPAGIWTRGAATPLCLSFAPVAISAA